jgi:two-component system, OmpR family, sensor histidine kinase MprB
LSRRRLTVAAAAAGSIAILIATLVAFLVVRARLYDQVDDSLRSAASGLVDDKMFVVSGVSTRATVPAPMEQSLQLPGPPIGNEVRYAQVSGGGRSASTAPHVDLPTTTRAQALARKGGGSFFSDATIDGVHTRVYVVAKPDSVVQVARSLDETDAFVGRLGWILAAIAAGGTALALGLALWLTRAAAKPIEGSFEKMVSELERSNRAQRQLVADASHELRTPLTSLRTNLEVLARSDAVRGSPQQKLVGDAVGQIEELTVLVGDLVELARDDEQPQLYAEDVRLDEVALGVIERARLRHPERRFHLHLRPVVVHAVPARLDRAIANLVDNAVKWGPPDKPIDVVVEGQTLSVRDRFFRAPAARAKPGSGLGLAIVRRFAEDSGGTVAVARPAGGGAQLELTLPVTSNELPIERSAPSKSAAAEWPHDSSHTTYTRRGHRALGRLGRLRE